MPDTDDSGSYGAAPWSMSATPSPTVNIAEMLHEDAVDVKREDELEPLGELALTGIAFPAQTFKVTSLGA
jgi:hypothetical protein